MGELVCVYVCVELSLSFPSFFLLLFLFFLSPFSSFFLVCTAGPGLDWYVYGLGTIYRACTNSVRDLFVMIYFRECSGVSAVDGWMVVGYDSLRGGGTGRD